MIKKETYHIDWITKKSTEHRNADKILIEKVIMALHLLEELKLNNIDFIFKGGTSLVLLMPEPKRFSIDIDIIISGRKIFLESIFQKIIENSYFTSFEEQHREPDSEIYKAHFKFFYSPLTSTKVKNEYILLDILFEENHYTKIIERPILAGFIMTDDKPQFVKLPDINCILGDKLAAFAPNTTGVPYRKNKEIEIIKQLFDVGCLFDYADDLDLTRKTKNSLK